LIFSCAKAKAPGHILEIDVFCMYIYLTNINARQTKAEPEAVAAAILPTLAKKSQHAIHPRTSLSIFVHASPGREPNSDRFPQGET
jgi:hypothetical protein